MQSFGLKQETQLIPQNKGIFNTSGNKKANLGMRKGYRKKLTQPFL